MNTVLNAVADVPQEGRGGERPNADKSGQGEGVNFCQFYVARLYGQSQYAWHAALPS